MSDKLTRQGVRDLDIKYGKRERPLPMEAPPKESLVCLHPRVRNLNSGDTACLDCDALWDWNGVLYAPHY
jgi:hypothetical protein